MPYSKNYKIIVEYFGGAFHGWQKQKGLLTVQSELERVIRTVLHSDDISPLQGAGRTDAGVHARGQVVNFRTDLDIDSLVFKHSVSSMLKGKLAVLSVEEVPMSFNALRSATSRQYSYRILNRPAPAVLDHARAWHVSSPLDVSKLRDDALCLVGERDFTSFRASGCLSSTPIKTIRESEVIVDGEYLIYRVIGKGFLKQMVRIIVGTLVQLNRGKTRLNSMSEILEAKDRRMAGVTAPPHGLYLDQVFYD